MKKICMHCMRTFEKGDLCPHCGEVAPQKKLPEILVPGTSLNEQYLIGHMLGRGGFGITYIGYDLRLDRRVAIKEYFPNGIVSRDAAISADVIVNDFQKEKEYEDGKNRFLQEARALAQFHEEDGVVNVYNSFEENNTAYIVMEYLDGATLQQCIQGKTITTEEALKTLRPVMTSLERVHEQRVIHRDISPDNIMVLHSGKMKLIDFGAAKKVDFSNPKTMSVVLKIGFAPPEQYRAQGNIGPWTDVYALSATLYMCITGKIPENAMARELDGGIEWPTENGIEIPEALKSVLEKGLAYRWKERYQSVSELREALDKAEMSGGAGGEMIPLSELVSEAMRKKEEDRKEKPWSKDYPRGYASTVKVVSNDPPISSRMQTPPVSTGAASVKQAKSRKQSSADRKKIILVIAAVLAAAMIGVAAIWISGNQEETSRVTLPSYLSMMNDAKSVLEDAGVEGVISSLEVTQKLYNEKFGTYKATCLVIVSGETEPYAVTLVYDQEEDGWILNELSKIS